MKRIIIPKEMGPELAEEIGIHIGDGSLLIRPESGHYEYYVCLSIEEKDYMKYVCRIIHSLYSLKVKPKERPLDGSLYTLFSSKQLAMYKLSLGLPSGDKGQITIPKVVFDSKFVLDCIRGIFDTDGSLTFKKKYKDVHYYPVIHIASISKDLILQMADILSKFRFTYYTYLDEKKGSSTGTIIIEHSLFISGRKSLDLWMGLIGSSSPIHTSKYLIWKRFGFCPPKTTLSTRRSILEGKVDPVIFERDAGGEI
ncbi:MAG: hypothetical protein HYW24_00640 [Candidatus Aenigmarchaeota archaeon]|nr:hypothetical protein [Candidatus Aenigmarchaeota archaeon]